MKAKEYKQIFKSNKISHRMVAKYVGYTRESITLMLNGKEIGSISRWKHVEREFKELLDAKFEVFGDCPKVKRKEISTWFNSYMSTLEKQ